MLLVLQCTFAVLVVMFLNATGTSRINVTNFLGSAEKERFVIVVVYYVICLLTNMKSLQYSNVDTVICLRMTAPLLLSAADYLCLGRELPSLQSTVSMVGVATFFATFSLTSFSVDLKACMWLLFWYFAMVFETAYVKHVVSMSQLSTSEQTFYQNLLSAPLLFLVSKATNERFTVSHFRQWSITNLSLVTVSCILGLGMSYLGFLIRKQISATSFTVLGNTCKLLTILVNAVVWDMHATVAGTVSVLLCICCSIFYEQAPLRSVSKPASAENNPEINGADGKSVVGQRAAVVIGIFILVTCLHVDGA